MQSPLQAHSLHFLQEIRDIRQCWIHCMPHWYYPALVAKRTCQIPDRNLISPRHLLVSKEKSWQGGLKDLFSIMPTCTNHVTSLVLLKNSSAAFFIILPRISVRLTDIKLSWSFHLHCLAQLSFFFPLKLNFIIELSFQAGRLSLENLKIISDTVLFTSWNHKHM